MYVDTIGHGLVTHQVGTSVVNAGHPATPGCSLCYFLGLQCLKKWKCCHQQLLYDALTASLCIRRCETRNCISSRIIIPGSWFKTSRGTLRSLGQTWHRISSVSSPPSLIAILLRAATSTGLTLSACVISAIFLFRLVSQSGTDNIVSLLEAMLPHLFIYLLAKRPEVYSNSWHDTVSDRYLAFHSLATMFQHF